MQRACSTPTATLDADPRPPIATLGGTDTHAEEPAMTDQQATTPQGRDAIPQLAQMLKDIDVCVFATRADDGELHARPMSNNREVEWDGDSFFFARSVGRLVSEVSADPSAVTAYRKEEGFGFISVSGRVTVERDPELKKQYWLDDLERWFPNGPEDPGVTLLRLEAEHADWWTEAGDGSADLRQTVGRA
jgi:general stress protein 26